MNLQDTVHWPDVTLDELVTFHVRMALKRHGNVSAAARALGVHRRTLQRMMLKDPTLYEALPKAG
jgi:ActR/RegA family two-component response regulator